MIDARIPLGVQSPQIQSPLDAMTQIAQLQQAREATEARRLAAEEARQKAADQAAVRRVLAETGGDIEQALPRLRQIAPQAALEFETEIHKARKEKVDALRTDMDYRGKKIEVGLKVAQSMTDEAGYRAGRPMLLSLAPELAPLLPETYDPAAVERLQSMGLSAKDVHDRRQEGLKLFTEGKATEALGTYFSTARTPQEWDSIAASAVGLGTPKELVAQFGTYSPENVARATQLAMTPAKRAELAGQAATREQTAAHQAALEANAAAQLGISAGNLGVARGNLAVSQAREAREAAANPAGVKLSDTQKGELATMMTVEELANNLVIEGKKEGWAGVGPGAARVGVRVLGVPGTERAAAALGGGGKKGIDLRSQIGNIKATIALMRGGTSFTVQEQKLLESYTPTDTDTGAEIELKVKNLTEFIALKRANVVRVAQGQFTPPAAPTTTQKNPFR